MKALVICSCLLIFAIPLQAKLITLTSSLSCEVTPPMIKVILKLKNNGDETAYNIQARFKIKDKQWLSKVFPKLEVNKKLKIEHTEKLELERRGTYPLIAKIHFHDAAGYPFTTIVVTPFTYKEAVTPNIFGKLQDLTLWDKGALKLNITNMGHDDLSLDIRLFVPDELSVKPNQKRFIIKARSKEEVLFKVNNFSALTSAIYPAWAVIEYESKDQHFTHICSGGIKIKQKANIFKKYWWLWLTLTAMIIALFAWFNLRRQKEKKT